MTSAKRPSLAAGWTRFQDVDLPLAALGEKIGGKVGLNIATGIFANACPIRISYVLNYAGAPVPRPTTGYSAVSGADRKWYLFRMREMIDYLTATFGEPDVTVTGPTAADLAGMQGILLLRGAGASDAGGHVTLWDGLACPDDGSLPAYPANVGFEPEVAKLWLLA